jgi:GGDEF domain-containing protein
MENCRETDLIGRSGEQEIVLCVVASREQGRHIGERIWNQLADKGLRTHIGLSAMPDDGDHPTRLFERAETALTTARETESGAVQMFEASMEPSRQEDAPETFGKEIF